MKCEIMDRHQRLDDFIMEKLSTDDAEAFEIHLFGCPECLEELRLREQMVKLIKEERVTAIADYPTKQLRKQRRSVNESIVDFLQLRQHVWIYAGAAAVLLIGLFVIQLLRRQESPDIYAVNFVEVRHLESKLRQSFRSSEFSLSIISPKIGDNFTGDILFRWEVKQDDEPFSGPLELKILNNREDFVHVAAVENGQYAYKEKLAPGLYYWTLEHQGEMLYVGKFFVKKPER